MTRFLTAVLGALLLAGCGEERELREWTPEDHGQPPQSEMDPTRIPGQRSTGTPAERAAAALWVMQCASCHGRVGRGDGPEQPPGAQMEDFTRAEFQASRTDEELAAVIVTGRGLMPEFGDQLPEQAVRALVGHIRRLGPQQPSEPPPPEEPAEEPTEEQGGSPAETE